MNKFDVVNKIRIRDYLPVCFKKEVSIEELLREEKIIRGKWEIAYFNWGRNALFALFRHLPYETIHFPAFTCPVLTGAAEKAGKKVKLLEVSAETFNLDLAKLPRKAPECLVVVHTFGNPVDIKKIRQKYPKTFIIEDCAHALYAEIGDRLVGSQGDAVLFSLYKQMANLNGALLLTKEPLRIKQKTESIFSFWPRIIFKTAGWHHLLINLLRQRYIDTLESWAYSDQVAPHPLVKSIFVQGLRRLKRDLKKQKQVVGWYQESLANHPYLIPQKEAKLGQSSWYQMVVRLKPAITDLRDQVVRSLRQQNIFLDRLWYSAPITERKYVIFKKNCPEAFKLAQSVISLPAKSKMSQKDVQVLVNRLTKEIKLSHES